MHGQNLKTLVFLTSICWCPGEAENLRAARFIEGLKPELIHQASLVRNLVISEVIATAKITESSLARTSKTFPIEMIVRTSVKSAMYFPSITQAFKNRLAFS
ncbi:hypothetical protein CANINC_000055 [Pichia inconspicua]|uniref:Uncharacterized protein n=1 Tax=Pichia inconspicua TaxID=52247 RepID=A0A4T0X9L4_9ASCO|nr:hypothetical protein CANINC_000055 [[Candida] inconspicua]